ncbi:MAG: hypothetical protein ACM3JQ_04575 [Candidatus Eiseniibacteriota bacterium]
MINLNMKDRLRIRIEVVNIMIDPFLSNGFIIVITPLKPSACQTTKTEKTACQKWVDNFLKFARAAKANKY